MDRQQSYPFIEQNRTILLSFDIDGTLIDESAPDDQFYKSWNELTCHSTPILTYNSGRLIEDILDLVARRLLPVPHFIIGGVGTQLYDYNKKVPLQAFQEELDEGWDLESIENTIQSLPFTINRQAEQFQHAFKRSYHLKSASRTVLKRIQQAFDDSGLKVAIVYSGNIFLDILPEKANKGNALQWLIKYLDHDEKRTIVAGDSGNDIHMFELPEVRGIIVRNGHKELLKFTRKTSFYHARASFAKGVIEGLIHHDSVMEEENKRRISTII